MLIYLILWNTWLKSNIDAQQLMFSDETLFTNWVTNDHPELIDLSWCLFPGLQWDISKICLECSIKCFFYVGSLLNKRMSEDVVSCLFRALWRLHSFNSMINMSQTKPLLNNSVYNQCIKLDRLSVQICLRSLSVKADAFRLKGRNLP